MVDMHLEVHVVAVSDVEQSKQFYESLGWPLDTDMSPGDGVRRRHGCPDPTRTAPATSRTSPSTIRTAIGGWSRRSRRDLPADL